MADSGIPHQEQRLNTTLVKDAGNDYCSNHHLNDNLMDDATINDGNKPKNDERNRIKTENKYALLGDDWGKTVISQSKAWDLPPSPQSSSTVWSTTGTEIWENSDKTKAASNQWGHTPTTHAPSTHFGGTWGEEEDTTNVWTGASNENNSGKKTSVLGTDVWNNSSTKTILTRGWNDQSANPDASNNVTHKTNTIPAAAPSVAAVVAANASSARDPRHSASSSTINPLGPTSWGKNNANSTNVKSVPDTLNITPNINTVVSDDNDCGEFKSQQTGTLGTEVWGSVKPSHSRGWDDPMMAMDSQNMSASKANTIPAGNVIGMRDSRDSTSSQAPVSWGIKANSAGGLKSVPGTPNAPVPMNTSSDEVESSILKNPTVLGTDLWNSAKPSLIARGGWDDSLISMDSSNNMPTKANTIPSCNPAGVSRDTASTLASQGPVSWGCKDNNMGGIKSIQGTPNAHINMPGSGWGADPGASTYWNQKPRGGNGGSGGGVNWLANTESDVNNWTASKSKQQPPNKDNSNIEKVSRLLYEMGCKKEDIERALRQSTVSMNDLRNLPSRDNDVVIGGKGPSNTPSSLLMGPSPTVTSLSSIIRNPSNPSQIMQPPPTQAASQTHHLQNVQQSSQQPQDQSQLHQPFNLAAIPQLPNPQAPLQSTASLPSVNTIKSVQAMKNSGRQLLPGQSNMPSEKQLSLLVQQIQLAVQSGHLNAQILNQPLAYSTIHLINQLLQTIKSLQQLQQAQQITQQKNGGPMNNSQSLINVQITQTKLKIQNLQNQIGIQQAMFLKQQQQLPGQSQPGGQAMPNNQSQISSQSGGQSQPPTSSSQQTQLQQVPPIAQSDSLAQGVIHPGNLSQDFDGLSIKDTYSIARQQPNTVSGRIPLSPSNARNGVHSQQAPQPHQQNQQSRLRTTWKLPGYEREDGSNIATGSEFTRAPGPFKQSNSNNPINRTPDSGNSWPNILQSGNNDDSAWSTESVMNIGASSPNASSANSGHSTSGASTSELKDIVTNSLPAAYNIGDLVAEFEPGKPWKGSSSKIEDDPHITPGSVTRLPLMNMREPNYHNVFNWPSKNLGPTGVSNDNFTSSLGISNSTWAFNPNTNTGWGSIANDATNPGPESPWNGSISKARGPPPGLGQDRNAPRGDVSIPGIRPQANPLDWMMTPSNDGDQLSAVANANIDSKDVMFTRVMAGIDLGMGLGVGGMAGAAPRGLDDSAALELKNLALNRCNSTNPMLRNDMALQPGINQEDGNWQLWPYMQ